jgi:hypothetical protein
VETPPSPDNTLKTTAASALHWRNLSWPARVCVLLTKLLFVMMLLELTSRAYWLVGKKVPFFSTTKIFHTYFPEWAEAKVDQAPRDHSDPTLDVLVLGPSVWHRNFGDLAPRLGQELEKKLQRPVKIYNLSFPGRTSRDALLAYRRLAERRFDLVVVYHGINDQFLNNIPAENYHHNYSHASRFEELRLLDRHPEHGWFALPYTMRCLGAKLLAGLSVHQQPDLRYGQQNLEPKTPASFRANLEKILDLAQARGERVLLTTFAYYIPENYTEEAFAAKTLDYAMHMTPLKRWGTPANVARGLQEHNAVIQDLAVQRPEILFADVQARMPNGKQYFDDCCHLTLPGCARYMEILMDQTPWEKIRRQ